jgi:hypothetical protein
LYLFKGNQKKKVFINEPLGIREMFERLVLPQGHKGSLRGTLAEI